MPQNESANISILSKKILLHYSHMCFLITMHEEGENKSILMTLKPY